MADFGLGAAYGAQNLQGLLRQRLADQIAAQERDRKAMEADRSFGLQQQQFQSNEELKRAQLEALTQNRQATEADRKFGIAQHLGDTLPADTFVPQQDPAVGMMQTGGTGSLLNPTPATQPMGPDFTGPMPNSETPQQAQIGRPAGFIKTASSKQSAEQAAEAARLAAIDQRAAAAAGASTDRNRGMDIKEATPPKEPKEPTPHFSVVQTYGPDGKPAGLQRINTLTGDVTPVAGANIKPAPGATQEAAKNLTKQTGLNAVNRLDSDLEQANAAGLLGPGAGRWYSALAKYGTTGDKAKDQIIGHLKGDLVLTKLHVDAGVGGARAASSPLLMKNWEDVAMSGSLELLKGYTSSMREDMGGEATTTTKSTAAELIKKYGGR